MEILNYSVFTPGEGGKDEDNFEEKLEQLMDILWEKEESGTLLPPILRLATPLVKVIGFNEFGLVNKHDHNSSSGRETMDVITFFSILIETRPYSKFDWDKLLLNIW